MKPAKPQNRRNARKVLLKALYAWQNSSQDPSRIIQTLLLQEPENSVDVEYFEQSFRAIIQKETEYGEIIATTASRPVTNISPVERAILWIACYEFITRVEIPYKVIINEAIELAKSFGAAQGHKFVNGVLDKLAQKYRADELKP